MGLYIKKWIDVFESLFREEALHYNVDRYFNEVSTEIEWKNEDLKKIFHSNKRFKDTINFHLFENLNDCAKQYTNCLIPAIENDILGFRLNSCAYPPDVDDPTGWKDSKDIFNQELIDELNAFTLLKDLNLENFEDYFDFIYE